MRRRNISPMAAVVTGFAMLAWVHATAQAAEPTTMSAATKIVDATTAGAVGDGITLNTTALQKAIDACSAAGGGVVRLPAGRYVTGTIQLKDNVTLRLDDKAFLLGSTNAADYRNVDPFIDGTGNEMGYALVAAVGAKNVGIDGKGTIDGRGKALSATQTKYTIRPFLVRWVKCTDIVVKDGTMLNSGAWGMNLFQCRNVTVSGLTIRNRSGLANNDGIDIDSCHEVSISDCTINSGDDAVCLKTTSTEPCGNITVSGCTLQTSCNAIKLGTESIGDFEYIRVSACKVQQTGMSGIALYSVDGAILHDVAITDIAMDGITVPISIRLGARLKTFRAGDTAKPVGAIRDVAIRNVSVSGAKQIGMLINGVPGHDVQALTLENIKIALAGGGTAEDARTVLAEKEATYPEYSMFGKVMPAFGIYVRHVDGVSFKNVQTTVATADARPAIMAIDVKGMMPVDFVAGLNGAQQMNPATKP